MTITLTPAQFDKQLKEQKRLAVRSNPPQIMSVQEVAWFIDSSQSVVYGLVAEGKIPARKDGDRVKFHLDEIRPWAKTWRRA